MSTSKALAVLALAVSPILASPFPVELVARVADPGPGACRDQSCAIAIIAGSTGESYYPYTFEPTGDTQDGDCCIVRYFPAVKDELYTYKPGLQAYCQANGGDAPKDANPPGITSVSANPALPKPTATTKSKFLGIFEARATEEPAAPLLPRQTGLACKPNILIFAKGTAEPGNLGVTIGPSLMSGLDSNLWTVAGVEYDNSFANDLCLGLPGGINTRQLLLSYATQCPNSAIAMSGYSQGALVVRNGLARADASAVARVKNVVTFGDPMIGAKIGQYSGPIHAFCQPDDGVCNGTLSISLAHLSYGQDVSEAVTILEATEQKA